MYQQLDVMTNSMNRQQYNAAETLNEGRKWSEANGIQKKEKWMRV